MSTKAQLVHFSVYHSHNVIPTQMTGANFRTFQHYEYQNTMT